MRLILALITVTNPAWAACAGNERTFMSCNFANGKAVEVCMTDNLARYSFGQPGHTPELALSLGFGQGAEFVPWTGIGRTVWEAVRLTNNDITYDVYGGFDKFEAVEDDPNDDVYPQFGGIYIVDRLGKHLAHLQCIPSTVNYAY
jgi:hypothetical protein